MHCRGLGVLHVGAYQAVDGCVDESPADRLEYLCLLEDGGKLLGCRGPREPSGVLCDCVGLVSLCEGVQSSVQGAPLEVVPGFFFRMATDAFGVSCEDLDRAGCVPSVVSGEKGKLFKGELESGLL